MDIVPYELLGPVERVFVLLAPDHPLNQGTASRRSARLASHLHRLGDALATLLRRHANADNPFLRRRHNTALTDARVYLRSFGSQALRADPFCPCPVANALLDVADIFQGAPGGRALARECRITATTTPRLSDELLTRFLRSDLSASVMLALAEHPDLSDAQARELLCETRNPAIPYGLSRNPALGARSLSAVRERLHCPFRPLPGRRPWLTASSLR